MTLNQAVEFALAKVLREFKESSLYEDYAETDSFSDYQYQEMLDTLEQFVELGQGSKASDNPCAR